MAVEISPDLEQFVEQEVASGHFSDRSSVIEHALRLMQRDREEAIQGIRAGLDDAAAGRIHSLEDTFAGLRQEFKIVEDE